MPAYWGSCYHGLGGEARPAVLLRDDSLVINQTYNEISQGGPRILIFQLCLYQDVLMESLRNTSLAGLDAETHRDNLGSDLPVIAESSQPSVANMRSNTSTGDITKPSRQLTQQWNLDGPGSKPADDEVDHEQQRSVNRTHTAEARSWSSKRTHPIQILDRTTSSDSDINPQKPNRNSTMKTDASASFEETAPWDRKAILSLGKFHDV